MPTVTEPKSWGLGPMPRVTPTTVEVNVAVTDFAASIVTTHGPAPSHAPAHPSKVDVASATAVKVTDVLASKVASHVVPQSIAAGDEETVPPPVPSFVTVRPNIGEALNFWIRWLLKSATKMLPSPSAATPSGWSN